MQKRLGGVDDADTLDRKQAAWRWSNLVWNVIPFLLRIGSFVRRLSFGERVQAFETTHIVFGAHEQAASGASAGTIPTYQAPGGPIAGRGTRSVLQT